jgi:hypothetical protein
MKIPTNPIVMGLSVILIYSVFLSIIAFGVLYYRSLAETAKTQQIACPLAKYCKAGTSSSSFFSGISISFPTAYSDYTEETLSFPYFDSFASPTEKTLTLTFDNTTTSIPAGGVTFMGLTGVGWTGTSPDYTIYINGLSAYSDLSEIIPALFTELLNGGDSPVRKQAFMNIDNLFKDGNPFFNYQIKVPSLYSSLTVSSDNSDSVILSGTSSITFFPSELVNPGHYVNVYDDFNYLNKNQVANSLDPTKSDAISNFSWCVDPSFVPESCDGLILNNDGEWVPDDTDPSATVAKIWQDWDDFDNDSAGGRPFCAFNLDKTIEYGGRRSDTVVGDGGIGSYQINRLATDVVDNTLKDPSATPLEYTAGSGGTAVANVDTTYRQDLIFCGGENQSDNNISADNTIGSTPYQAKYPNKAAQASNYTSIGF